MQKGSVKTKSFRLSAIILGLLAALLILLAWQLWANKPAAAPTEPTPTRGNVTKEAPTSNQDAPTPTPTSTGTRAAAPAKPTLQMSSGNVEPVPAGVSFEFTCEGTANSQCEVTLTDKANASHVINLGKKPIAGDGYGHYAATFVWTTVKGSWRAVASSTNPGSTAVLSDTRSLQVN